MTGSRNFHIYKAKLARTITLMYKLNQVCIDKEQNYLCQEGRLSFLHLKTYWQRLSSSKSLVESESEWDW